jgi:hypothetical protein
MVWVIADYTIGYNSLWSLRLSLLSHSLQTCGTGAIYEIVQFGGMSVVEMGAHLIGGLTLLSWFCLERQ